MPTTRCACSSSGPARHDPNFTVTDANAAAVAQICQRLDGIALALELAAARVRTLPVERLAGELDQRFRVLTGGARTVAAPPAHPGRLGRLELRPARRQ